MRKASLLVFVGLVVLASCKSSCPAYTHTPPTPPRAAPAVVLTAQAPPTPQPE
ncbi:MULTISPECIES: hypothetical protein [Hymenobacter]|uniref:Uncharacterized protein n=2 Tax=Hymenobacter TaxID=89966 RepID=A0ABS6X3W0_9BACT|nr:MULTISPECIES: hypothetical protein [Hymenobacter]MBO3270715.1 hypothetical protein [Hymenobacter defluvii]MBW3130531.1 hypothetical protein [Hymenobacter profundi]